MASVHLKEEFYTYFYEKGWLDIFLEKRGQKPDRVWDYLTELLPQKSR